MVISASFTGSEVAEAELVCVVATEAAGVAVLGEISVGAEFGIAVAWGFKVTLGVVV
jgi:hypothetical protein